MATSLPSACSSGLRRKKETSLHTKTLELARAVAGWTSDFGLHSLLPSTLYARPSPHISRTRATSASKKTRSAHPSARPPMLPIRHAADAIQKELLPGNSATNFQSFGPKGEKAERNWPCAVTHSSGDGPRDAIHKAENPAC